MTFIINVHELIRKIDIAIKYMFFFFFSYSYLCFVFIKYISYPKFLIYMIKSIEVIIISTKKVSKGICISSNDLTAKKLISMVTMTTIAKFYYNFSYYMNFLVLQ